MKKDTKVEETKPSTTPIKLQYTIETANGKYTVKRPVGRVGVVHFTIITSAIPQSNAKEDDGTPITSPGDQLRFNEALVNWTEKVLPSIYVDGPFKVDEIPGEDVYALFIAMFTTVNFGGSELFRFVE